MQLLPDTPPAERTAEAVAPPTAGVGEAQLEAFPPLSAAPAAAAAPTPGGSWGVPNPLFAPAFGNGRGLFGTAASAPTPLFAAAAAAAVVANPAPAAAEEAEEAVATDASVDKGPALDPASPAALEAIADAPVPAAWQQQQQQAQEELAQASPAKPQPQQPPSPQQEAQEEREGLLSAEQSGDSGAAAAEAEPAERQQRSPLLQAADWRERSDSPQWRASPRLGTPRSVAAAAAAAVAASQPPAAAADAGAEAAEEAAAAGDPASGAAFSPGPLQGALLYLRQAQQQRSPGAASPSGAPGTGSWAAAEAASGATGSGAYVTAASQLSEGAGEIDAGEVASPRTEPLR